MLLTAFLLMILGYALLYAGIKGGEYWRKPWQPIVDQLRIATPGE